MGRHSERLRRAVFLDRDGVLNRSMVRGGRPYPPDTLSDFEILPGVKEACERLKAADYLLIVATNQPDVKKGLQKVEVVELFHSILLEALPLDDIKTCFDLDAPDNFRYKPKPGMLLEAAAEWDIDLSQSFMVGDRWRDVGAGKAAGCKTIFIEYGYEERRPDDPDHAVRSLAQAADIILLHYQ